ACLVPVSESGAPAFAATLAGTDMEHTVFRGQLAYSRYAHFVFAQETVFATGKWIPPHFRIRYRLSSGVSRRQLASPTIFGDRTIKLNQPGVAKAMIKSLLDACFCIRVKLLLALLAGLWAVSGAFAEESSAFTEYG